MGSGRWSCTQNLGKYRLCRDLLVSTAVARRVCAAIQSKPALSSQARCSCCYMLHAHSSFGASDGIPLRHLFFTEQPPSQCSAAHIYANTYKKNIALKCSVCGGAGNCICLFLYAVIFGEHLLRRPTSVHIDSAGTHTPKRSCCR